MPDSPFRVFQEILAELPDDIAWLTKEVLDEVNDPRFKFLRHGERHTRNRGCKGPLCRKALRDWQRQHVRVKNAQVGLPTRRHRRSEKYLLIDPVLAVVKLAHDEEFKARRVPSSAELQTALAG